MADTLLDLRAQAFGRNILQTAQQKYSKLLPFVYQKENVVGKTFFQDRIGEWSMTTKASPNATTPENDPALSRRMGYIYTEHDSRLLDRSLNLQVLSDPKSEMTISAGSALGRAMDNLIIDQLEGNAYTGETGSTTQALTAGQQIANGGTGLTFEKVLQAKRILDENDVEDDGRVLVVSPQGLEDMLAEAEATSRDYVEMRSLVSGKIKTFLGFEWVVSTLLNKTSTIRNCLAFHRFGLAYAMTEGPFVRVDERNDKSYSYQVYYELNHGAVRLEEERVVQIGIVEV